VSPGATILMLEESAHHKASAWVAKVVLPTIHGVTKALKLAFFETHSSFEIISILLRHLVHIAESCEAIIP
jgi:hypothetical protein